MKVLYRIKYPMPAVKQIVEAYRSSEIPQRPDYVKELGSIVFPTPPGYSTVYLFDVPDDKILEFERIQNQRNLFIGTRTTGFVATSHIGLSITEGK